MSDPLLYRGGTILVGKEKLSSETLINKRVQFDGAGRKNEEK